MAVTDADFIEYASASDKGVASKCLAQARDALIVLERNVDPGVGEIPESFQDMALLDIAHQLYKRRTTQSGNNGFVRNGQTATPQILASKDPMEYATALLSPWLKGGFA